MAVTIHFLLQQVSQGGMCPCCLAWCKGQHPAWAQHGSACCVKPPQVLPAEVDLPLRAGHQLAPAERLAGSVQLHHVSLAAGADLQAGTSPACCPDSLPQGAHIDSRKTGAALVYCLWVGVWPGVAYACGADDISVLNVLAGVIP